MTDMSDDDMREPVGTSRRAFLRTAGLAAGGAVIGAAAGAQEADPLITEVQDWATMTGEGVDATPYGMPIRFEGDVVRRTGRIGEDDLRALYAVADVVAVPSRFEGFGAPALEAMSAGVPVVVADATALPWVVGDAGLKVPVGDVARWADALGRVLDRPAVHDTLAAAGRVRAATFTWDRAARDLAESYRAALGVGETGAR